jgi:hypothetical protein
METNARGDGAGRNYTPRCRRNVPVIASRLRLGLNGAPRPHRRCPQDRLVDRRGSFLLHPDLLHRQLPHGESRGLSEQPVVVPCGREQQGPPGGITDVPNRRRLSAAFRSASASWLVAASLTGEVLAPARPKRAAARATLPRIVRLPDLDRTPEWSCRPPSQRSCAHGGRSGLRPARIFNRIFDDTFADGVVLRRLETSLLTRQPLHDRATTSSRRACAFRRFLLERAPNAMMAIADGLAKSGAQNAWLAAIRCSAARVCGLAILSGFMNDDLVLAPKRRLDSAAVAERKPQSATLTAGRRAKPLAGWPQSRHRLR